MKKPNCDTCHAMENATVAERERCIRLAIGWAIANGYYPKRDGGTDETRQSIRRALGA